VEEITCPYCGAVNDVETIDYNSDELYEEECDACGKTYGVIPRPRWDYDTAKLDCRNGMAEHKWRPLHQGREYPQECIVCTAYAGGKEQKDAMENKEDD